MHMFTFSLTQIYFRYELLTFHNVVLLIFLFSFRFRLSAFGLVSLASFLVNKTLFLLPIVPIYFLLYFTD